MFMLINERDEQLMHATIDEHVDKSVQLFNFPFSSSYKTASNTCFKNHINILYISVQFIENIENDK